MPEMVDDRLRTGSKEADTTSQGQRDESQRQRQHQKSQRAEDTDSLTLGAESWTHSYLHAPLVLTDYYSTLYLNLRAKSWETGSVAHAHTAEPTTNAPSPHHK